MNQKQVNRLNQAIFQIGKVRDELDKVETTTGDYSEMYTADRLSYAVSLLETLIEESKEKKAQA